MPEKRASWTRLFRHPVAWWFAGIVDPLVLFRFASAPESSPFLAAVRSRLDAVPSFLLGFLAGSANTMLLGYLATRWGKRVRANLVGAIRYMEARSLGVPVEYWYYSPESEGCLGHRRRRLREARSFNIEASWAMHEHDAEVLHVSLPGNRYRLQIALAELGGLTSPRHIAQTRNEQGVSYSVDLRGNESYTPIMDVRITLERWGR